jgi:hypothetical protein
MLRATTLADRLGREARSLEIYIRRTEALFDAERVPRIDLDRAYTASYILFYVMLERSIEDLFVGLLTTKLAVPQTSARPIVVARNRPTAMRLVLGDRRYVDWLPYSRHTLQRAEALFSDGKPFAGLTKAQCRFLDAMSVLRNALSHRSEHSLRQFEREFISGNPVPGGFSAAQRKPVGYLRSEHASNQSRLSYQMAEGTAILRLLCS